MLFNLLQDFSEGEGEREGRREGGEFLDNISFFLPAANNGKSHIANAGIYANVL